MDYGEGAREELKRVDHLIYTSLKYTRTVDVIKTIIERMVTSFDYVLDSLIEHNKDKIDSPPAAPAKKCEILNELYKNEPEVLESIKFYQLLRKILRSKYESINEFRRHVTMIATINKDREDESVVEVDIDTVMEYYKKIKVYYDHFEKLLGKPLH